MQTHKLFILFAIFISTSCIAPDDKPPAFFPSKIIVSLEPVFAVSEEDSSKEMDKIGNWYISSTNTFEYNTSFTGKHSILSLTVKYLSTNFHSYEKTNIEYLDTIVGKSGFKGVLQKISGEENIKTFISAVERNIKRDERVFNSIGSNYTQIVKSIKNAVMNVRRMVYEIPLYNGYNLLTYQEIPHPGWFDFPDIGIGSFPVSFPTVVIADYFRYINRSSQYAPFSNSYAIMGNSVKAQLSDETISKIYELYKSPLVDSEKAKNLNVINKIKFLLSVLSDKNRTQIENEIDGLLKVAVEPEMAGMLAYVTSTCHGANACHEKKNQLDHNYISMIQYLRVAYASPEIDLACRAIIDLKRRKVDRIPERTVMLLDKKCLLYAKTFASRTRLMTKQLLTTTSAMLDSNKSDTSLFIDQETIFSSISPYINFVRQFAPIFAVGDILILGAAVLAGSTPFVVGGIIIAGVVVAGLAAYDHLSEVIKKTDPISNQTVAGIFSSLGAVVAHRIAIDFANATDSIKSEAAAVGDKMTELGSGGFCHIKKSSIHLFLKNSLGNVSQDLQRLNGTSGVSYMIKTVDQDILMFDFFNSVLEYSLEFLEAILIPNCVVVQVTTASQFFKPIPQICGLLVITMKELDGASCTKFIINKQFIKIGLTGLVSSHPLPPSYLILETAFADLLKIHEEIILYVQANLKTLCAL